MPPVCIRRLCFLYLQFPGWTTAWSAPIPIFVSSFLKLRYLNIVSLHNRTASWVKTLFFCQRMQYNKMAIIAGHIPKLEGL